MFLYINEYNQIVLDMRSITKLYQQTNSIFGNKLCYLFSSLKYTKSHEWVQSVKQTKRVRIGITNFAQQQLGQIVHVELPTVGKNIKSGDSAMTIESVKMAADVYSPISGKVVQVNEEVTGNPGSVNERAQNTWLFEVQYTEEPQNLLNSAQYEKITQQSH